MPLSNSVKVNNKTIQIRCKGFLSSFDFLPEVYLWFRLWQYHYSSKQPVKCAYITVYSISGQCNAGTFYSLFVWVMILPKLKPNIYFRGKSKEDKKPLHIILIVLLFIMSSKQIHNCSTPNSAPTSADLSQCTAVWGSIIIHHCTLLYSLSTLLSLLVLQPFTPKANRKKWFTRPQ